MKQIMVQQMILDVVGSQQKSKLVVETSDCAAGSCRLKLILEGVTSLSPLSCGVQGHIQLSGETFVPSRTALQIKTSLRYV